MQRDGEVFDDGVGNENGMDDEIYEVENAPVPQVKTESTVTSQDDDGYVSLLQLNILLYRVCKK